LVKKHNEIQNQGSKYNSSVRIYRLSISIKPAQLLNKWTIAHKYITKKKKLLKYAILPPDTDTSNQCIGKQVFEPIESGKNKIRKLPYIKIRAILKAYTFFLLGN
jgi:hypothetical protein